MKNTNFTKIAVLVLSLALLMGAVVAVSASAADEPEIFAQNVIYGDKISIVYAVDTTLEAANAGEVKVKYYWEDAPEALYDAVLLDTTDTKNLCEGKPTFATTGVAPKELGKVAYATVYTGNAPAADAEWKSYSVAEYLYDRLYKDGYVNYDEGDGVDYNRKNAYEALLDLGANLQLVLGYETNELVTEYTYAYTTNADVTINGKRAAFDVASVNAVYNGSLAHVGWTITDLEGNETEAAKDAAIAVNGVIAISPKIDVHECADTNNDHYCDKCSEKLTNCGEGAVVDGLCDVCKKMTFDFGYTMTKGIALARGDAKSATATVVQTSIGTGTPDGYNSETYKWGVLAQVTADPKDAANKVLKIDVNSGNGGTNYQTSSGKLTAATGTSVLQIKLDAGNKVADGNIHIFEYDFYMERSSNNNWRNPFALGAYDASGNYLGVINIPKDGSDNSYSVNMLVQSTTATNPAANAIQLGISGTQTEEAGGKFLLLDGGAWVRIQTVYDASTGKMDYSVSYDGGNTWYKACSQQNKKVYENVDSIGIIFNQYYGYGGYFYFDNINYTITDTMPELPVDNGITE